MSLPGKMSLTIQTKDLAYALNFANSVAEKRNIIADFNNVKLTGKNGNLEIIVTDLGLSLMQNIGANITEEGQTSVSVRVLSDIARKFPDQEMQIKQKENEELEIIGKTCLFNLRSLPPANFPTVDLPEDNFTFTVSCKDLGEAINRCEFSISREDTRINLSGLYLHFKDNKIFFASTDGHRLSVAKIENIGSSANEDLLSKSIIIPRKTVQELSKIILDSKYINFSVNIHLCNNKIGFSFANIFLISKLIEGFFPSYENFIPKNNNSILKINAKLLETVIDRVSIMTIDKFRAIKFIINREQGVKVISSGENTGNAQELIPSSQEKENLCHFNGEEISIGFNPKYFTEVLKAIKDEEIIIELTNNAAPALIKTPNREDDCFVIMPVKI